MSRAARLRPVAWLSALVALATLAACRDTPAGLGACTVAVPTTALSLFPGIATTLSATARCDADPTPTVRWTSSAPSVVAVDSVTGRATAVALGTADIAVSIVGSDAAPRRVSVTVVSPCGGLLAITLSHVSVGLSVGGTAQVTAVLFDACDAPHTHDVIWSSADTTIATVDSTGTVRGVRPGATRVFVTARANPAAGGSVAVTVAPPVSPENYLYVTPSHLTLSLYQTVRLQAAVLPPPGSPATTSRAVTFRSSDSCLVRVDSSGAVTSLAKDTVAVVTVASVAFPTMTQTVAVRATPFELASSPLTVQRLTTGPAAAPVDPAAVRGAIDVTFNFDRGPFFGAGRADLFLGGQLLSTAPIARSAAGQPSPVTLTFAVNTDQRDVSGARRFLNGDTTLELRVTADGDAIVAGCPNTRSTQSHRTGIILTLANP